MKNYFKNKYDELEHVISEQNNDYVINGFGRQHAVNVLLIEDSPIDALFFNTRIAQSKSASCYDVVHTKKLSKAIRLLKKKRFDIAVLDLQLPDTSGDSSVSKIRSLFPDLPIVVLTGSDDYTTAVKTLRAGAQDFLVKGRADSNALCCAMEFAINKKQTEEQY